MPTVPTYDLVVVGGGVQGLWIARTARVAGLTVALVEAARCGAGASGGLLGALMPHMPAPWGQKKAFQFEALAEMEGLLRALESETGIATGYDRVGRLMAIRNERFRETALARAAASRDLWRHAAANFRLDVVPGNAFPDWIAPRQAPFGLLHDTLSARIHPRQYLAALEAAAIRHGAALQEGWRFAAWDPATGTVSATDGARIRSARVILANGHEAFTTARSVTAADLGGGIKGQAAMLHLARPLAGARPILYDDGLYLVAHGPQSVAIGSTTESDWHDAAATDELIDQRIDAARALSPALDGADIRCRWAGIRPKAWRRDPIVGPLDDTETLFIASGGFKITFGIAHAIAREAVAWITTGRPAEHLPETFRSTAHLTAAADASHER